MKCQIIEQECPYADGGYCRTSSPEEMAQCLCLPLAAYHWKQQHDDMEQQMQTLCAERLAEQVENMP